MAEKINIEPLLLAGAVGGDFDHLDVAFGLAGREDPVTVRLASDGGEWASGVTIYHQLRKREAHIVADFASSAAVVILLAGRHRTLAADGWIFVHGAWSTAIGNGADLRAEADRMDDVDQHQAKIIAAHTRLSEREVLDLLRREPRLSPDEALDMGFIDEIGPAAGTTRPKPSTPASREVHRAVMAGQVAATYLRDDLAAMVCEAGTEAAQVDETFAKNRAAVKSRRSDGAGRHRIASALQHSLGGYLRRAHALRDGRPLPAFPAGAWRCHGCRRLNFHPPADSDGPAPCAFCGVTN